MRSLTTWLSILAAAVASGCATGSDGSNWKCSAQGLINAYYDGSEYAQIHLQGFNSPGRYKVTKNAQGTEASGATANGTAFKCVKAQ